MIKKLVPAIPTLGLMLALLLATPSSASVIQLNLNLSLANPVQFSVPGGPAISFIATLSAPSSNTGDVYLNADNANVDFPLTLDDSAFFSAPLFLSPGQSYTAPMFAVTVPAIAVSGVTYHGFFEIDGGADANAGDRLASVTFAVTATPEPGTMILLLSGFAAVAVAFRRKHRNSAWLETLNRLR